MWLLEMFDAGLKPVLSHLSTDREAIMAAWDNAMLTGKACHYRLSRQTDTGWRIVYQSVDLLPF